MKKSLYVTKCYKDNIFLYHINMLNYMLRERKDVFGCKGEDTNFEEEENYAKAANFMGWYYIVGM